MTQVEYDAEEVEKVIRWALSGGAHKRKTINKNVTSYGLKHVVERTIRSYISNDSFIEAMQRLGYKRQKIRDTPNYRFNITYMRSPNAFV